VRHIEANGELFLSHPQTQNRPFELQKRGQLFIRVHDETPPVTMRVNNPD
jgi:hypothetical protein